MKAREFMIDVANLIFNAYEGITKIRCGCYKNGDYCIEITPKFIFAEYGEHFVRKSNIWKEFTRLFPHNKLFLLNNEDLFVQDEEIFYELSRKKYN